MTIAIILISLIGLSSSAKFGYPKYRKYKDTKLLKEHYNLRMALDESEWKKLKHTIQEECKGFIYSDALLSEVLNNGHRFSCKQIYELREIYIDRNWHEKNVHPKDYIDWVTHYKLSAVADAEEKVFAILNEPKETLLLTN